MRRLVENQQVGLIRVVSFSWNPTIRWILNITGGSSFILLIVGIVILSTIEVNEPEKVVIITYIVLEFVAHFQFFVCLLIMALLPLFCIFFCIYLCCCQKGER